MPINLTKGQKISLSKEAPNLKIALVGLGWDIKQYDSGADFDYGRLDFPVGQHREMRP